jgi:23S rRNA (uridine2552-2'-O)-methyltransferase
MPNVVIGVTDMADNLFGGKNSGRSLAGRQKVKTAKRRTVQSARWLERQLNDPYVRRAQSEGYRSRAAYKLVELDEKFHILRGKRAVVDLGIAPGGWAQVVRRQIPKAAVVGIDLLPVEPLDGVILFELDFMHDSAPDRLIEALGGAPDLILSDMAANTVGHKQTDHLRTMGLVEAAVDFAVNVLKPGGDFVAKVFAGGTDPALLSILKSNFTTVKHAKPPASRKGSVEWYVIAQGKKA